MLFQDAVAAAGSNSRRGDRLGFQVTQVVTTHVAAGGGNASNLARAVSARWSDYGFSPTP